MYFRVIERAPTSGSFKRFLCRPLCGLTNRLFTERGRSRGTLAPNLVTSGSETFWTSGDRWGAPLTFYSRVVQQFTSGLFSNSGDTTPCRMTGVTSHNHVVCE